MRCRFLLLIAIFLLGFCAEVAALELAGGAITTEVKNRTPVDEVQSVGADVGKLYCFTHLVGASETTSIFHVWYRNGEGMARVELPVRSSNWRTWSSKRIVPEWSGEWKVDVLDHEGHLLMSLPFTLL